MALKNKIKFILKKTKLNKLIFSLFKKSCVIKINDEVVKKSLENLEKIYPYHFSSCFRDIPVTSTNEYDVQIIVPCYNVEKYIKECLDSINLKRHSYIVTVINDGSNDSTPNIIDRYRNNKNFEIIHKPNGGVSSARNIALNNLKGKYIFFLDGDDKIETNTLDDMLDLAFKNNYDIIQGHYYRFYDNNKNTFLHKLKTGDLIATSDLTGFPWGKIFRAEMFKEVIFPLNYYYEDTIMSQLIYNDKLKCYGVNKKIYGYRKNVNSVTYSSHRKPKSLDALYINMCIFENKKKNNIYLDQNYYEKILNQYRLIYSRTEQLGENVLKNLFIVYSNIINTNFRDFSAKSKSLINIEKYIRDGDFGMFKSYCKYYN